MERSPVVTRDEVAAYRRDGVVCVRSVIAADCAGSMRAASEALMTQEQHGYAETLGKKTRMGDTATVEDEPGRFFGGVYMSEENPAFRDFVLSSALPEAAGALMESDVVRFFYDQLFIKEPGTLSPTLWHNDMPFWPLAGADLISCWVALTPVTRASSGIEYVAGSHDWEKHYQPTVDFLRDESLEPAPDFGDPANRGGHRFLSWDMAPGDVLFHHPLVVHGASGNASQTQRRIGLSVRYIGRDARWAPRAKTMKLPRDPQVAPGAYPADDAAFPIAWTAPARVAA